MAEKRTPSFRLCRKFLATRKSGNSPKMENGQIISQTVWRVAGRKLDPQFSTVSEIPSDAKSQKLSDSKKLYKTDLNEDEHTKLLLICKHSLQIEGSRRIGNYVILELKNNFSR